MIPKIIHYCWFGGNPLPEKLQKYMDSWNKYCPDYEIKIWNEESFDINSHIFTKTAYKHKKYAYVSDYVRAYALFHFGGVYLDTDIEIKRNIDEFLEHEAFSGFEAKGLPFTALWGSIKGHSMPKKVLNYYDNKEYNLTQETNTASVSELLIKDFEINPNKNILQVGSDGCNSVHIYPAEYFCLDLLPNYTTHHFEGSWIDKETTQKEQIHKMYYVSKLIEDKTNTTPMLKGIAYSLTLKELIKLFVFGVYYKLIPDNLKRYLRKGKL